MFGCMCFLVLWGGMNILNVLFNLSVEWFGVLFGMCNCGIFIKNGELLNVYEYFI